MGLDPRTLARPELYSLDATGKAQLAGMRCACGRVAFPRQAHGCEQCGRTDTLAPLAIEATGVLAAVIRVHLHPTPYPKAPFALGAVKLDAGPMVRVLLAREDMQPGQRVGAVLAPTMSEDGQEVLDLRFAPAAA